MDYLKNLIPYNFLSKQFLNNKSSVLKGNRAFCARQTGLEPVTLRLTAECSTIELLSN